MTEVGNSEIFYDGCEYKLTEIKKFTKGKLIGTFECWHRKIKKTDDWTKTTSFYVEVDNDTRIED